MSLTVGSLFSGIGGLLDLGLERAGMRVVWQAETDPYCCRVLARHWPTVPNLGDVTLIDWTEVPRVDLLAGGYPCQPFSVAGRRQGDRDARHLWPHMWDAVRLLRPRWVLLENVAGHLALGFGRVLGDLAEIGYDAEWDCIPAAAVGAPHRRDRVFIVAYPGGARRRQDPGSAPGDEGTHEGWATPHHHVADRDGQSGRAGHVADTDSEGLDREPRASTRRHEVHAHIGADADRCGSTLAHMADPDSPRCDTGSRLGRPWPPPLRSSWRDVEPPVCGMAHGIPDGLDRGRGPWVAEWPNTPRVAHGIPNRVDRLRALGNAVVPAVAEHVGRLITEATT